MKRKWREAVKRKWREAVKEKMVGGSEGEG